MKIKLFGFSVVERVRAAAPEDGELIPTLISGAVAVNCSRDDDCGTGRATCCNQLWRGPRAESVGFEGIFRGNHLQDAQTVAAIGNVCENTGVHCADFYAVHIIQFAAGSKHLIEPGMLGLFGIDQRDSVFSRRDIRICPRDGNVAYVVDGHELARHDERVRQVAGTPAMRLQHSGLEFVRRHAKKESPPHGANVSGEHVSRQWPHSCAAQGCAEPTPSRADQSRSTTKPAKRQDVPFGASRMRCASSLSQFPVSRLV